MPLTALLLTLLAALLHAVYNFFIKSSRDTIAYYWWTITLGALGYGAWLLTGPGIALAPASVPFFLLSALAEVGFFVATVRGYAVGDLSLVYPLARGSPPVFVALWSLLFLNELLPPLGYLGVAIVVAGIFIASLSGNSSVGVAGKPRLPSTNGSVGVAGKPRLPSTNGSVGVAGKPRLPSTKRPARLGFYPAVLNWRARDWLTALRQPAALWALGAGVFIAIYSVSDKIALSNGTSPTVYNFWVFFGNLVSWLPIVWTRARVRVNLELVRVNLATVLLGSAAIVATYFCVLTALTMTSASYVTAGRSMSVVVGALLGTLALKEGFGRARIIGAVMMVVGIALMAVA